MAEHDQNEPLATLRARLALHARDPRAQMIGLAPTLTALDAAIVELSARIDTIAAMQLRWVGGIDPHPAQLQRLAAMGPEASTMQRVLLQMDMVEPHDA